MLTPEKPSGTRNTYEIVPAINFTTQTYACVTTWQNTAIDNVTSLVIANSFMNRNKLYLATYHTLPDGDISRFGFTFIMLGI